MTYRLSTFVTAVEQGGKGRTGTFGPETDLSAPENSWLLKAISNPNVWDGDPPPLHEPVPLAPPGLGAGSPDHAEVEQLRSWVSDLERQVAERDVQIAELKASQVSGPNPTPVVTPDPSSPPVPPRGGPGSAAPAWRDYAAAVGVEVAADASRDDVIAALELAGKPTE